MINRVFSGTLATDDWIFAIADINATGTGTNLVFNSGQDQFSPKTTSTVVPELSTLILLGSGLIALWGSGGSLESKFLNKFH